MTPDIDRMVLELSRRDAEIERLTKQGKELTESLGNAKKYLVMLSENSCDCSCSMDLAKEALADLDGTAVKWCGGSAGAKP